VFLWEGVSQYLTPAAVDGTLCVVHALGTSPSRLIMTYVDARALREPSPFPEARRWVEAVARAGEPWIFGLLPDRTAAFFAERGFRLLTDVSTLDAGRGAGTTSGTARSVPSQRRRGDGSALYRVCVCDFAAG
jgi:O-methyltransferase involved in polyketide biosynthesis